MQRFKGSSLNEENVLHGKIRGLGKMRRGSPHLTLLLFI